MLQKSLQTITWGDPQHQLFDHIFGLAARSGFQGVELGFRRLGQVSIDTAKALLDKHQIALSAVHIGGNLTDLTQAANERDALDTVLSYLSALGSDYLIYSGLNVEHDSELTDELGKLQALAQGCAGQDIKLLYHNHDWEFRNERRIWDRLQEAQIANLAYAPDLGWAVKGGQDMGALLEEIGDEVKVLHFKDFVTWEDGQNTCHLGEGVVDFSPAWSWLAQQQDPQIWITAEQDNAEDNDKACLINSKYLADQLARAGG